MYYLLSDGNNPRRWIDDCPYIKGLRWWQGKTITIDIPDPLEFTLKPYSLYSSGHALHMGAIIYTNPPLWRDDFIEAIRAFGVTNSVSIRLPSLILMMAVCIQTIKPSIFLVW